MISCGYNGWADVPEDQREALEIWEAKDTLPAAPPHRAPAAQSRVRGAGLHGGTRREAA